MPGHFTAVYYRELTRDAGPARYDLDYDGAEDDVPPDIQVDRSRPQFPCDHPVVASRTRPANTRGGQDEAFTFSWVDTRRGAEGFTSVGDNYFVSWRPQR
jgi:hypothetical protein